jgi:hypothetical protein
MKRATAEIIVAEIRTDISSLFERGLEERAFNGEFDNYWIDFILKAASKGE